MCLCIVYLYTYVRSAEEDVVVHNLLLIFAALWCSSTNLPHVLAFRLDWKGSHVNLDLDTVPTLHVVSLRKYLATGSGETRLEEEDDDKDSSDCGL
jgi:hypothetical protein